jgi:hypothetical protein
MGNILLIIQNGSNIKTTVLKLVLLVLFGFIVARLLLPYYAGWPILIQAAALI